MKSIGWRELELKKVEKYTKRAERYTVVLALLMVAEIVLLAVAP